MESSDSPLTEDKTMTSSNSTSDCMKEDTMSPFSQLNTVAYHYVMPVLLATGIISNIVNIGTMYSLRQNSQTKKNQGPTTTYTYLYWLAVSQLLACISIIPSLLHLERCSLTYGWAFYFAHFEILVVNSMTSTCVYIIIGLSIDRFVAVCRPHAYQLVNGPKMAKIRIATSFLVPPVLYAPLCLFQKVVENGDKTGYKPDNNEEYSNFEFWNVTVELCHRFTPSVIIVVLNVCIIIRFRRLKAKLNDKKQASGAAAVEGGGKAKVREQQQESKLLFLLMGVIVVFLVSTLPSAFLGLTDSFGHQFSSISFEIFRSIANLLEVLGFSLNFFLYFVLVKDVRKKILQLCTAQAEPKNRSNTSSRDQL